MRVDGLWRLTRPPLLVALAAAGVPLVLFHRAVLSSEIFIARDLHRGHYPLKRYFAQRVLQGEFPLWYPFDGLGQPFVGMVTSAPFHPMNVLYLLFPLGVALKLHVLAAFPLALVGTALAARRFGVSWGSALLAAVVYACSGYLVSITSNLQYLWAAATLPLALWSIDRFLEKPSRVGLLVASGLLALLLFAGDPECFFVACLLVPVLTWIRHRPGDFASEWKRAAGLVAAGGLLASVQILPALDALTRGRPSVETLDKAQAWSLHPIRLLEFAVGPLFRGGINDPITSAVSHRLLQTDRSVLWVDSVFVGAAPVVLAGVALALCWRSRAARILAAATALLGLLALGKFAWLYGAFFKAVPLWSSFRYPEKLLPFVVLALAMAAAVGIEHTLGSVRTRHWAALALALVAASLGALWSLEAFAGAYSRGLVPLLWSGKPSDEALAQLGRSFTACCAKTGLFSLACAGVFVLVRSSSAGKLVTSLLAFAALWEAHADLYPLTRSDLLSTPLPFATAMESVEGAPKLGNPRVFRLAGRYRYPHLPGTTERDRHELTVANALEPDTTALRGLESASPSLPAASARVMALWDRAQDYFFRIAPALGTRYFAVSAEMEANVRRPVLRELSRLSDYNLILFANEAALPRAYLSRYRCVNSEAEALQAVLAPTFPEPGTAIVECDGTVQAPAPDSNAAASGRVEIARYRPEEVDVKLDAGPGMVLVLNDAYYPGWSAAVDGHPATIHPTNYAVRGVFVPPGAHEVRFRYSPGGLLPGLGLSLGAVAALLFIAVSPSRRARA